MFGSLLHVSPPAPPDTIYRTAASNPSLDPPCDPQHTLLLCCVIPDPQTKLQELHRQIEELTGKVSNLQTENAALHSRTSILEKVLDMRNEQIQVMQENKEVRATNMCQPRSKPTTLAGPCTFPHAFQSA